MTRPHIAFGTPRRLPKPASVPGRVVVVDIAFAAEGTGHSFEKVTAPFLAGLGDRLAAWVDHHDHAYHARYADDARFVLATKAMHGACPEMVTASLVARIGAVDSVLCHTDLDGLYAAAKWIRGGEEPYPGADADARAIDTRIGVASPIADALDRALRVRGRDEAFLTHAVDVLVEGVAEAGLGERITSAAREYQEIEEATHALASTRYVTHGDVVICDVSDVPARAFDKTELLLRGQTQRPVAVVLDAQNVTLAAPFDSGINFLTMLGLTGGMPTRVSVPRGREAEVRAALRAAGLWR